MNTNLRIGQGYDVHAFETGKQITLGGVVIPCQMGIKAHSDGDVVIHALVDALLGAGALGDKQVDFFCKQPFRCYTKKNGLSTMWILPLLQRHLNSRITETLCALT